MTVYIISDLHLSESHAESSRLFFNFLNATHDSACKLYILGDLFEYWVGDDIQGSFVNKVITAIRKYSVGKEIYFIAGNRDFLIGREFAAACNMKILPDPCCHTIDGTKILFSHGDILCQADRNYQRYRNFVQHPISKKIFLKMPQNLRQKIAKALRKNSAKRYKLKQYDDSICSKTTMQLLNQHNSNILIHGHTHVPNVHLLENNNRRVVLGAWDEQAKIVQINNAKVKLVNYY